MDTEIKTVCIVGTGSIGLCAIHWCLLNGFQPQAFEQSSSVGGVWNHGSETGNSPAYDSLFTNSSVELMQLSDFQFPFKTSSAFPKHTEIKAYLTAYSKFLDKDKHISFRHKVTKVRKAGNAWEVTVLKLETKEEFQCTFDAILVCSGRLWNPSFPPWYHSLKDACFDTLHSCEYRNTKRFHGKNVLVVGIGNSALDISLELSQDPAVKSVTVSTRSRTSIIPTRGSAGEPTDTKLGSRFYQYFLNSNLRKLYIYYMVRNINLEMQKYGLNDVKNEPKEPLLSAQISNLKQSSEYIKALEENKIKFLKGVKLIDAGNGLITFYHRFKGLEEQPQEFADLSNTPEAVKVDAIIFCTGYKTKMDFLDEQTHQQIFKELELRDKVSGKKIKTVTWMRLANRILYPNDPTIGFLGMFTSLGNETVIGEMQARWVTTFWKGRLSPSWYKKEYLNQVCDLKKEKILKLRILYPGFETFVLYMDKLAEDIGCKPDSAMKNYLSNLSLYWKVFMGPVSSPQFRLQGPNALPLSENYLTRTPKKKVGLDAFLSKL